MTNATPRRLSPHGLASHPQPLAELEGGFVLVGMPWNRVRP
ncbi:hypothetical protein [Synechococcus sp. BA-132 BA5]|nr:hypothetical protein [Synechococcus sp. BA-132 BA5]MEA5414598.1 hypothetical protein [Synechococcus sp. BA-132 BA5]